MLTSRAHHAPSVKQKMEFPQRKQPFRAGLCYAFVSTGRCRKPLCPYKHACPSCGGNPVAATTQSLIVKQNKCCIQSPILPTPVIVNNLALLLGESRYDLDLIHKDLHAVSEFHFKALCHIQFSPVIILLCLINLLWLII